MRIIQADDGDVLSRKYIYTPGILQPIAMIVTSGANAGSIID
jgi:hypothetical protein